MYDKNNIRNSSQNKENLKKKVVSLYSSKYIIKFHIHNLLFMHFDWIPYFEGKYLTYYQYFALVSASISLLVSFVSFLCYLLLAKYTKSDQMQSQIQQIQVKKSKSSKILQQIFFQLTFYSLCFVPLFCSAFTVISIYSGISAIMLILVSLIYIQNYSNYSKMRVHHLRNLNWLINFRRSFQYNKINVKKQLILAGFVSILLPVLTYRTCLCYYNVEIGYNSDFLGFGMNTMVTRLFQYDRACPPGPPCHLYATLPEDAAYAVFINVQTHPSTSDNVVIYYQQIDSYNASQFYSVKAKTYHHLGLDWKDQRNVHSGLIMNLKPNTKYLIKVFYDNQFWTNAIYKTLSDDPSLPIKMINAGDSGYTQKAIQLTKIVATLRPDIFFIGGDIAYDDNMPACVYTWDYYLKLYGSLTSTLGYLMPLVLTVGNHDVGLNELSGTNITINEYSPAYFIYFPQHYDRNANFQIIKTIPPINRRRSVFYHTFSNIQYISLDSGYIQLFRGFQELFLVDALKMYPKKIKFVNYHVPIYSGCQSFDRESERFLNALFHFVPHFDNYKVMTVFQNHIHSFKRTKPLIGNIPKQNGTVYVGDGAFGANADQSCKPDITINIFEKQMNINNFWFSIVSNETVEHYAYEASGKIVDSFIQNIHSYV